MSTTTTSSSSRVLTPSEAASLISRMDRKEDEHIFARDLAIDFPQLIPQYEAICPHRTDLGTMRNNALAGRYSVGEDHQEENAGGKAEELSSTTTRSAYSPGVQALIADVELLVNNCIAFNGLQSPYAAIAQKFRIFALGLIEKAVERPAPKATASTGSSSATRGSTRVRVSTRASGGGDRQAAAAGSATVPITPAATAPPPPNRPAAGLKRPRTPVPEPIPSHSIVSRDPESGAAALTSTLLLPPPGAGGATTEAKLRPQPHHVPVFLPLELRKILLDSFHSRYERHLQFAVSAKGAHILGSHQHQNKPRQKAGGEGGQQNETNGGDEPKARKEKKDPMVQQHKRRKGAAEDGVISVGEKEARDDKVIPVCDVLQSFLTEVYRAVDASPIAGCPHLPVPTEGIGKGSTRGGGGGASTTNSSKSFCGCPEGIALLLDRAKQRKAHYKAVVETIENSFNDVFLSTLLYERELNDAYLFLLATGLGGTTGTTNNNQNRGAATDERQAIQMGTGTSSGTGGSAGATGGGSGCSAEVPWSRLVSAEYLLRWLVHFPQVGFAVATTTLLQQQQQRVQGLEGEGTAAGKAGAGGGAGSSGQTKTTTGTAAAAAASTSTTMVGRSTVIPTLMTESVVPVVEDLLVYLSECAEYFQL